MPLLSDLSVELPKRRECPLSARLRPLHFRQPTSSARSRTCEGDPNRPSLGNQIADKAFGEWLVAQPEPVEIGDKNAELIAELLVDQINQGNLRIPRGGYLVRRGRGRVIVEIAAD